MLVAKCGAYAALALSSWAVGLLESVKPNGRIELAFTETSRLLTSKLLAKPSDPGDLLSILISVAWPDSS